MMKKIFGASWKTSLMGLLAGLSIVLQDFVNKDYLDWKQVSFAVFVFLLGRFANDHKNEVK